MFLTQCPACGSTDHSPTEEVRGYHLVRCGSCGLEYTQDPEEQVQEYERAYGGDAVLTADAHAYVSPAARLALEERALFLPPPYLTPAERWVLERIRRSIPSGARVLDVGCGTGRFLRALRRAGLNPVGVDPAANVVRALRHLGFEAHVGSIPGLDVSLDGISALTAFEVLEHLPSPLGALAELRERFPNAPFGGSVPSPDRATLSRGRGPSDYPPNHYLRWTPGALEKALLAAGWSRVVICKPRPAGSEFMPGFGQLAERWLLGSIRKPFSRGSPGNRSAGADGTGKGLTGVAWRIVATGACWGQWGYRAAMTMAGMPLALRAARRGTTASSMAFWAEP